MSDTSWTDSIEAKIAQLESEKAERLASGKNPATHDLDAQINHLRRGLNNLRDVIEWRYGIRI